MENKHHIRKDSFLIFACSLGIILFLYVVLRSFLVEPIHDELATLFHYIDYGTYWGRGMTIDANNHLLNSFLGKICYSIFGDHIWAIRLPNVLSFLLFFYSVYRISRYLKIRYLRYVFLIAMTCIPYILDYFGYCRGYGMSMAFMLFSIYLLLSINIQFKFWKTALMLFSLLLCCYANLNLMVTAGLILGYLGVKLLILGYKTGKYTQFLQFLMLGVLFLAGLYIPIKFAFLLRDNGALYYGSKAGLWLTTGATLSKVVLFTKAIGIKYVILIFLVFIVGSSVLLWKHKGAKHFFEQPATLWSGLIFGNLIAIVLMRWLFGVNFPEDRVGMQLIFFFIGATLFALADFPRIAKIGFVFLVFPIVGGSAFNFNTSVFSPDDRMEQSDFNAYVKNVPSNTSSALYMTQQLTYAYHVRKSNSHHFFIPEEYDSKQLSFIYDKCVSTKMEFVTNFEAKGYVAIRKNPLTSQVIMVPSKKREWQVIQDTNYITSIPFVGTNKFYTLDKVKFKKYHHLLNVSVQFNIEIPKLIRENLIVVVDKTNKTGQRKYDAFNLGWAAGKNHKYTVEKTLTINPDNLDKFGFYLYNPNGLKFKILNHRVIEKVEVE